MLFAEFLDSIKQIKSYERYSDFEDDVNYNFEIFALNHFVDLDGKLNKPNYSISNLSDWIIYIEQRAITTQNKIVRSRYNDLLWTYKKEYNSSLLAVGNVKDKCELAIADYTDLAEEYILRRESDENLLRNLQNYLYRAWDLGKQIKSTYTTKLIQLMIDIENSINEDDKIGLWGFSFKKLVKDASIPLLPEQESSIVERIITRVKTLDSNHFHALEYGIKMLLEYYKTNTAEQEKYLDIFEENAHVKSDRPFENQNRFRTLVDLCHKYHFKERKERAIINYQHYGKDIHKYMFKIEEKVEITEETKQSLIATLASENSIIHFLKIAHQFIISKQTIQKRVEENNNKFLFKSFFQTVIANEDGVIIKALSSEEDTLFHESKLEWQILFPYLYIAIENYKEKHKINAENLKDLLFDDMLYKGQEKTLSTAIQAYFNKDFFSMCYILIPLIENGLRNILFQCDHSIYEENKHDGFENVTLSRILNTLEEYLAEDTIFYLKFVLNEKAALNIRNNLTHGLMGDSHINERTALTLLHILMILKSLVGFNRSNFQ